MFTDRLPEDRKGVVVSELTEREAQTLLKKGGLTPQTTQALEHAVRAVDSGVARAHLVTRRVPGSLLLELFTHTGVGTMITADPVEQLRTARITQIELRPRGRDDAAQRCERSVQFPPELAVAAKQQDGRARGRRRHDHSGRKIM